MYKIPVIIVVALLIFSIFTVACSNSQSTLPATVSPPPPQSTGTVETTPSGKEPLIQPPAQEINSPPAHTPISTSMHDSKDSTNSILATGPAPLAAISTPQQEPPASNAHLHPVYDRAYGNSDLPGITSSESKTINQALTADELMEIIKGQVGIVVADVFFSDAIGNQNIPTSSMPVGTGFFINDSTVVMTKHQNDLEGTPHPIMRKNFYFVVPLRGELFRLELLRLSPNKDLAFFEAQKVEEYSPFRSETGRNLPPIYPLEIYSEPLQHEEQVRIITLELSLPHEKIGQVIRRTEIDPDHWTNEKKEQREREDYLSPVIEMDNSLIGNGDSGSPVLIVKDGKVYVVGIVTAITGTQAGIVFTERIEASDLLQEKITAENKMTSENILDILEELLSPLPQEYPLLPTDRAEEQAQFPTLSIEDLVFQNGFNYDPENQKIAVGYEGETIRLVGKIIGGSAETFNEYDYFQIEIGPVFESPPHPLTGKKVRILASTTKLYLIEGRDTQNEKLITRPHYASTTNDLPRIEITGTVWKTELSAEFSETEVYTIWLQKIQEIKINGELMGKVIHFSSQ